MFALHEIKLLISIALEPGHVSTTPHNDN
jgi:hypothetical protein